MKYTHKQFKQQFPNDTACLDHIFNERYGNAFSCPQCGKTGFYRVTGRKCYACKCGYQLHPLANTIFHKSSTKLTDWFFAIYLMSASKNGVSAKELERHLGCTYKTAWRIAKKIRDLMKEDYSPLKGTVEIDETYVGRTAKNKVFKQPDKKTPVLGMIERNGRVKTKVLEDTYRVTLKEEIEDKVQIGTQLVTDGYVSYQNISKYGYKHSVIDHKKNDYVLGNIHTNTIEGYWSQMKRSINGTYHSVSTKYLQNYLDEFSYRYNHRSSDLPLFQLLLNQLCQRHGGEWRKSVVCPSVVVV